MKTPRSLWWAPGPMSDQQHQFSQSQQYQITIPRKSYKNSDFISNTEYLPTFFWVRRDFRLGISENVPATSKDFRWFSEDLRTFPKISEDVPTNFEHLQSHLKGDKFSVFWKNYDTKSTLSPFMKYLCGNCRNWISLIDHVLNANSSGFMSQAWEFVLDAWDRYLYTLFLNKNVVFPAQAEYSYSSADFRLKIF